MVEKLDQAGIDKSKVFDVLSGLLHLGEVTFSTETSKTKDDIFYGDERLL